MFDLHEKRAVVTGSTQGIGYAIAAALVTAGAEVTVCGRHAEKTEKARQSMGAAHAAVADLAHRDGAARLFAQSGEADILVANASMQFRTPWDKIGEAEFDEQVNANLYATLSLLQYYLPGMQRRGWGRAVTLGSVQQSVPHPQMAVYAATKCAVMSLVRNIAKQVAASGVTVNNLSPGVIATPRNETALSDPVYTAKVLAGIPAGYAGQAQDLAAAALLLCSNEGRYITGIDLPVDGGMGL